MQTAQPFQIAFPCGAKLELPPNYFDSLGANADLKTALAKSSGKPVNGPIIDMIIALLPSLLPVLLPILVGSITPKADGDDAPGPVAP